LRKSPEWASSQTLERRFGCGSLLDSHGNLQVELWVRGEQVEVRRVSIRMWTPSEGVPVPRICPYGRRRRPSFHREEVQVGVILKFELDHDEGRVEDFK
jgi:hypothetical protein